MLRSSGVEGERKALLKGSGVEVLVLWLEGTNNSRERRES